jgi:hypothetical protein
VIRFYGTLSFINFNLKIRCTRDGEAGTEVGRNLSFLIPDYGNVAFENPQ